MDAETLKHEYAVMSTMSSRLLEEIHDSSLSEVRRTQLAIMFQAVHGVMTMQAIIAGEEGILL